MASSSNQTYVSPQSPTKQDKRKEMAAHLSKIVEGSTIITNWSVAFTKTGLRNPINITLTAEQYNRLNTAKVLAKQDGAGGYVITVTHADIRKIRKDWTKLVVTGTTSIIKQQRKRDPNTRTISGFNNPREFNIEILDFINGADSLTDYVKDMNQLKSGISTQGIITSLMTTYAYDKTSNNRASLVYFSSRNINAIQMYLQVNANNLGGLTLTEDESKALNAFQSGFGPEGISNLSVTSALAKVGIKSTTKFKTGKQVIIKSGSNKGKSKAEEEKLINGQHIGADAHMLRTLPNSIKELERRSLLKAQEKQDTGKLRSSHNFRFADLQTITSINFVSDPNKKYAMSPSDKHTYLTVVLPMEIAFRAALKAAKDALGKVRSSAHTITSTWNNAKTSQVNYGAVLQQLGDIGNNVKLRIALDSELQSIKIKRLRQKALARGIQLN